MKRILFLDIEGVMTRGMLGQDAVLPTFWFTPPTSRYSREATRFVRKLVEDHDFRIVLITRHHRNESAELNHRLAMAGVDPEWFYKPDPDAIPSDTQSKGDAMLDWFGRNPDIKTTDTVALEDEAKQLGGYPAARIVSPDSAKGFTREDYNNVLELFGISEAAPRTTTVPQASFRPKGLTA